MFDGLCFSKVSGKYPINLLEKDPGTVPKNYC